MKISFLIPAIVFYVVRVAFSTSVQVGTVLFSTTDLVKKCWTEPDKSLLKARLIMQDVLPDPDCIDFSNPEAVAILIDYFHSCYQIISTCTYGRLQNLMYIALSDALGGYLRAFVLPYARRSYYAGQVKYSEAKKLFQLYDDIRAYLKTNGVGWAEPRKINSRNFRVQPLVITGGALEACKILYSIEKPGKLKYLEQPISSQNEVLSDESLKSLEQNPMEDLKVFEENSDATPNLNCTPYVRKRKRFEDVRKFDFRNLYNSSSSREKFFEDLAEDIFKKSAKYNDNSEVRKSREFREIHKCSSNCLRTVIVPLPVLDDCNCPNSIAVPLKRQPFRNLKSRNSAFILEYYYVAVIKCFIAKGNTRSDIKNFNAHFHSWLVSQVMPHLNDEQWYPGFGGVLRIIQTIKKFGMEKISLDPTTHDIGFMFGPGSEFEVDETFDTKGKSVPRDVNFVTDCCPQKRRVLTTIIVVSLIWIFIFMACAFYCQATRGSKLLYEGYNCFTQPPGKKPDQKKDNINFQFFIKFFDKAKTNLNDCIEEAPLNDVSENDRRGRREQICPKVVTPKKRNKDHSRKKVDEIRFAHTGQGDPCSKMNETNIFQSLISHTWPIAPILPSYPTSAKPKQEEKQKGQGDQLQTLWKKTSKDLLAELVPAEGHEELSKRKSFKQALSATESEITSSVSSSECLEDETKKYTKEKHSKRYCTETCSHSTSTTSSSTTASQEDNHTRVANRKEMQRKSKKKKKKSLSGYSTEQTESEMEYSSSSEYDY